MQSIKYDAINATKLYELSMMINKMICTFYLENVDEDQSKETAPRVQHIITQLVRV